MEYSNGAGFEMPKWVITTQSNKKFYNPKENNFTKEPIEQSLFNTPTEANDTLKKLDFGYVVKPVRIYKDLENTRIRMV
ncbi:hypothetical protein [Viridibacillus arvi]|uniref:hypothetical protein n=1 Tax=Viridibacillus arvi TaxID=263475 RepID=UPI0034CF44BA